MATSLSWVVSFTELQKLKKEFEKFNCCLHELQATVTPPSSESENLMRKVPTSLDFRNSSASCLDTNPNNALNKKNIIFHKFYSDELW